MYKSSCVSNGQNRLMTKSRQTSLNFVVCLSVEYEYEHKRGDGDRISCDINT